MLTRPGSPAAIHGIMLVPGSEGGLTCFGADQVLPQSVEVTIRICEPLDQTT